MPRPSSLLDRWQRGYERERKTYAAAHRSRVNIWLHVLLSPIEWVAALVVIRRVVDAAFGDGGAAVVHALQILVVLGTAAARPPTTCFFTLPHLFFTEIACMAECHVLVAAAAWGAAIGLQVLVGHYLIEKKAPSAVSEPLKFQSVFLNVCITWDPL